MNIVAFAKAVLNDDNGISEEAYSILWNMAKNDSELSDLLEKVDATDGRFYLPVDSND